MAGLDTAGAGSEQTLVQELAQLVVEDVAPEELVLFEDTSAEYFADPDGVLDPRGRDEPVGFGLDLVMITPYALAVVASCVGFLVKTIAETATAEATKPAICDFLRRVVHRRSGADAEATEALSRDQAGAVREVALGRAKDLGLSEEQARLLADAVVGGLNVAG
jgi:hypothetical protein